MKEAAEATVTLGRIEKELALSCLAPPAADCEIRSGFASDVLSDVLARAPQGCVLVTALSNMNVIAVASYIGVAGVIMTSGYLPAEEVMTRASAEGIGLYATGATTFEVTGALSRLGVQGRQRRDFDSTRPLTGGSE